MGLVGWSAAAEASNRGDASARPETSVEEGVAWSAAPTSGGNMEEGTFCASDDMEQEKHAISTCSEEVFDAEESDEASVTSFCLEDLDDPAREAFAVVQQLTPRRAEEDDGVDISPFEVHEVMFVLEHAERQSSRLDYYRLARLAHAVKKEALEGRYRRDTLRSPNLDLLIKQIEEKYIASYQTDCVNDDLLK